ncbi:MAG: branched-chain amino acid ABC transporter substrate-binding protein, partial [Streptococcus vestibularis]|nr:branched-chain amino acid ABC transporter substrate-binding protein [Streptococcus vestibularis]
MDFFKKILRRNLMSKKITLIVLAFFASIFLVACGKSPDVTANA